jgi:hypothetical protein
VEKDLCQKPDCKNYKRYARRCGHYKIDPVKQTSIATFSKKREKINRKEYAPAVKKFLSEHTVCEIGMEGCTKKATCVHHVKGRTTINDLLNVDHWKASCTNCNGAVERQDSKAREAGNKISKHTPNYKRSKV